MNSGYDEIVGLIEFGYTGANAMRPKASGTTATITQTVFQAILKI